MSLQRALLLSIALHALVLAIARPQQPFTQKANGSPLIARLAEARLEPAPVQTTPAITPPRVLRRSAPPKPEIAQQALEHAVLVEQSPAPAFDPATIAKYRLEIISTAKQFRRYPPLARENGWQGKAEVRVSFEGAHQPAISVSRSSGYAVLDRQAVETLSKALAPLPPMLLGRSFELDFPVMFSLDE